MKIFIISQANTRATGLTVTKDFKLGDSWDNFKKNNTYVNQVRDSTFISNSNRKATQYELTSPIFYMEQNIPFSLIICEPFSKF